MTRGDADYPAQLLDLDHGLPRLDPSPAVLHGAGSRAALAEADADVTVTIVGSRRATPYGLGIARELARDLAAAERRGRERPGVRDRRGRPQGRPGGRRDDDRRARRRAGRDLSGRARRRSTAGSSNGARRSRNARRARRRRSGRSPPAIASWPRSRRSPSWSRPRSPRARPSRPTRRMSSTAPSGRCPGPVHSRVSAGTNALLADGAHLVAGASDVLDLLFGVGAGGARRTGPAIDPELAPVSRCGGSRRPGARRDRGEDGVAGARRRDRSHQARAGGIRRLGR